MIFNVENVKYQASGSISHFSEKLPLTMPNRHFLCTPTVYLPDAGVNCDHEGSSPRMRLSHCTPVRLNPTITPNVGNLSM